MKLRKNISIVDIDGLKKFNIGKNLVEFNNKNAEKEKDRMLFDYKKLGILLQNKEPPQKVSIPTFFLASSKDAIPLQAV